MVKGEPLFFLGADFSLGPHMIEEVWELPGVPFIKALISFMRALPSQPEHLPGSPSPYTIDCALGFQHTHFYRHKHLEYSVPFTPNSSKIFMLIISKSAPLTWTFFP